VEINGTLPLGLQYVGTSHGSNNLLCNTVTPNIHDPLLTISFSHFWEPSYLAQPINTTIVPLW